jgi:hypothetical protein
MLQMQDLPPVQQPQQQPPPQQRAASRGPPVSMDRMDRYRPQHRGARAGSAMGRAHSLNRAGHYDPRMPMEENEYYENSVTFQVSWRVLYCNSFVAVVTKWCSLIKAALFLLAKCYKNFLRL